MQNLVLYGHPASANVHRVRLLLSILGLEVEERRVDLLAGEHYGPAFSALNDLNRVPVLQDGDKVLRESYAILIYLILAYGGQTREAWWPADPVDQARVAQWLFFTANDLNNGVGLARNERAFGIPSAGAYAAERGRRALRALDTRLEQQAWLELDRPTLADVCVYSFVAVAPEAGIALEDYPNLVAWMERLTAVPGFAPMHRLPASAGVTVQ